MLTDNEINTLRNNIERYEGKINHLYLDSKGYVTVGVGHLLSTVEDAQKLPFLDQQGEPATKDMIAEEFATISSKDGNRVANYYQQFTLLTLSNSAIDALTDKHIDSFYKELKVIYDGFDEFPSKVKLALFDLIFNLGMTSLRKKWPKLNACIAQKDWLAAASNSRRRGIADERNQYVKDLLASSADSAIA